MHHHCINILAHKVFVHTLGYVSRMVPLPMTDWGGLEWGVIPQLKQFNVCCFFLIVAATNYGYIYWKPSQKMFKANFPKILRNWGTTKSE